VKCAHAIASGTDTSTYRRRAVAAQTRRESFVAGVCTVARRNGDTFGRAAVHRVRIPFSEALPMTTHHLDGILAALNEHQQRATYSAVAALLDQTPRQLMRGKPREQTNSWIVSKGTGRPTGYADGDVHPQLTANAAVLTTREELADWLASRG
jgi:hypothetical protein